MKMTIKAAPVLRRLASTVWQTWMCKAKLIEQTSHQEFPMLTVKGGVEGSAELL